MNKSWVRGLLTLALAFLLSVGAPWVGADLAGAGFESAKVFWIAVTVGLTGVVGTLMVLGLWLIPIIRADVKNDHFLQRVVAPLAGLAQGWIALFAAKIFSPPVEWRTLLFFLPFVVNGIAVTCLAHWWAKSTSAS